MTKAIIFIIIFLIIIKFLVENAEIPSFELSASIVIIAGIIIVSSILYMFITNLSY